MMSCGRFGDYVRGGYIQEGWLYIREKFEIRVYMKRRSFIRKCYSDDLEYRL